MDERQFETAVVAVRSRDQQVISIVHHYMY